MFHYSFIRSRKVGNSSSIERRLSYLRFNRRSTSRTRFSGIFESRIALTLASNTRRIFCWRFSSSFRCSFDSVMVSSFVLLFCFSLQAIWFKISENKHRNCVQQVDQLQLNGIMKYCKPFR